MTEHVCPHGCGLCDAPLNFAGMVGSYKTYTCSSPTCTYWHIERHCCGEEAENIEQVLELMENAFDLEGACAAVAESNGLEPWGEFTDALIAAVKEHPEFAVTT